MISLDRAIANANSFSALAPLIRQVQEEISFLGWRYVYVVGYEGRVSIDTLGKSILKIADATRGFNEEERALGRELRGRINQIYQDSDQRLYNKNFITLSLCVIREFCNKHLMRNGLDDRYMWLMLTEYSTIVFDYYTREQYEHVFRRPPIGPGLMLPCGDTQVPFWETPLRRPLM